VQGVRGCCCMLGASRRAGLLCHSRGLHQRLVMLHDRGSCIQGSMELVTISAAQP